MQLSADGKELLVEGMLQSVMGDARGKRVKLVLALERRMRELREYYDNDSALDRSLLGCYTLSTMGDHDGES